PRAQDPGLQMSVVGIPYRIGPVRPTQFGRLSRFVAFGVGDTDETAPFGPGAVVVTDVVVPEQVFEDKPGVAGALADPAVGDDRLFAGGALVAVDLAELVRRFERSVIVDRGAPRDIDGAANMARALGALLRVANGVQQLAGVFGGGADIDQRPRGVGDLIQHLMSVSADRFVGIF